MTISRNAGSEGIVDQGISEMGRRIIDAVIDAPVAWRSPGELAERLGWELERTLDEMADLDARGWLEAWELVDGPVVTLSVAATARCNVRLVEVGRDGTPRWARPGTPEPPAAPATGVFRGPPGAALDLVVDARPGAEDQAILAEEAEGRGAAAERGKGDADCLPRPTVLIGGGLSPWPGPASRAPGHACPACRSARLEAREYCLWCDRWGLDDSLLAACGGRAKTRRSFARLTDPKVDARARECARKHRKIKRRERRKRQSRQLRLGAPAGSTAWSGPIAS